MSHDRKTTLRELGDLHKAARSTRNTLERIRRNGVPNGCNLIAKIDAIRNYTRQIELRRAALYA